MKRLLATVLAALMALGLLTGCGQKAPKDMRIYGEKTSDSSQETFDGVTVNFFGYKADAMNLVAIESAIHGFMEDNPGIEIVYEGIKGTSYVDAFRLREENNTLDDLFMIHHDDAMTMIPAGKLVDLSDISTIDTFSDMAKSQFTEKDGSVYFVPTSITAFGLYVNLDMLEENGFDPPTNWAEFSEQCDYFKSQGITPIIGNNFTTLYTLISAKGLYPVYQMDNTAEMIEAFNSGEEDIVEYLAPGVEMVGTMLEKGWFDKEELKNTEQTSDDLALFAQGDRPFMITGGWASQRLLALDPKCKFAVYPYPVLDDGSVLVINMTTCLSISAESECVDEAKKFIEYLTQPDVIFEYCETQSSYTPLKDERASSDETIAPSAKCLYNGQNMIGSDFRLRLPIDDVDKIVGEAMLDGMSTEDAIELMRELISK